MMAGANLTFNIVKDYKGLNGASPAIFKPTYISGLTRFSRKFLVHFSDLGCGGV
jgi:hypothetical protein